MMQVDVRQLCLLKVNSFSDSQHYVLEVSSQLVRMVCEDLQKLLYFDWKLARNVTVSHLAITRCM